MAPPPGIAFYVIYMILSFGVGLLSFRFLIWFRARREAWKARQAHGTIRVPTQYVPTGISAGTLNTTEPSIKPLQMAVSITEHGDEVMGSSYIHRNSPLVTQQSIISPRADQLSGTQCCNLITSRGRGISFSVTGVQAARVREQSDYSETELSEIAPFLCDSTLNSQSTAHLVHEDGTGPVAPTAIYTQQTQTGPTRYYGSLRSPGTPRSVTHGEVSRPVFTNKRMVSEAVTLNGDAEELACYDAGLLPLYGFPRSPGTPRSVTHGGAVRPVFMSRRMVSEAVTLDGDAEEMEQEYYERMGMRGGGDDDTVVDEKEQVVVNEEAFDPSQFPPLGEWVVKVSKDIQEEEEKKHRWETAIEEAKEVVLSGWPTWQSYQRYLDWAFGDKKASERMLDSWRKCVVEAGRYLVEKHVREKGRKELVSISDKEVEGNETTAPRATVLEAALVMKESCTKLHKALDGMYAADSPRLRGMSVVVDRLEDTMIFLCYRWIGPRDIALMDGIDNWVAETPKQEIALKVLRKWKANGKGGDRFLWNDLERLLIQIKKPIGRHKWLGKKRKFFGGTLEMYTPDEKEEDAFCKAAGRERTTMRTWMAMSKPGARRNCKVYSSQKEVIDYYGIGDDITEKVKPPTVTTPAANPKANPITLTHAQATYIKNKAGLDAAEKAMAARDREFPSSQPTPTPTFGQMILKIVPCLKDMVNELSESSSLSDGYVKSSIFVKEFSFQVAERGVSIRGGLLDGDGVEEKKDKVEVLVDELADPHISDVNDDKKEGQDDNSPPFSDDVQREKLHYALSLLDDTILERLPLFQIRGIRFALAELHDIEKILHSAVNREFKGGERLRMMLRAECEYFLLAGKLCLPDEDEEYEEEEQGIQFKVPNYSALNWFPWSGVHENEPESDSDSDATIDQGELVPLPDSDSDSDLHNHTYGIPHPNPTIPICAPLNWFPWFKTHIVASSIIEAEKKFTRETEADAQVAVKRLLSATSDTSVRHSRAGHLKKHPDLWMWQCRDHEKACGECSMIPLRRLSSESVGRGERREMSLLKLHLVSRKNMGQVKTAMAMNELEEAMETTAYEDCADPAVQTMWNDAAYLWLTGHLPVKTLMTDKEIDAGPCGPGRIMIGLRLMLINLEERGGIITAFHFEPPTDVVDQEEVYHIQLQVTNVSMALLGIEAKMSMDEPQERLLKRCDLGGKTEVTGEDGEVSQNLPGHTLRGGYLQDEEGKYEVAVHIEDIALLTGSTPAHSHDSSSDCDCPEPFSLSASPWSPESVHYVHSRHTTSAAPLGTHTRALFTSFQEPDGTWKAIRDPIQNPDRTWMASAEVPNAIPWKEWTDGQGLQLIVGHLWDVEDFFRQETMWRQFVIHAAKGNFRALKLSKNACVDVNSTSEDDEDGKSPGIASQSSYDAWDPLPCPKQTVKPRVYLYASAEHPENQVSCSYTWAKHIKVVKFHGEDCHMDEESLLILWELSLFFEGIKGALLAIAHEDFLQQMEMLTAVNEELAGRHGPIADTVPLLSTPRTGSLRTTFMAKRKPGKLSRRFTPYPGMRRCSASRPLSPIPKETLQRECFDSFRLAYGHPLIQTTLAGPFNSVRAGGIKFSITDSTSQYSTDVAWAAFKFVDDLEEPVDRFASHNSASDPEKEMLPYDLTYGKGLTRLLPAHCKGVEKRSGKKQKGSTEVNWVRDNPKLGLGEKWIFPAEMEGYLRRIRVLKLMGMWMWWDKDARGAKIDDMPQPAPLSPSDQHRQMRRLMPALLTAIQASHQRALTMMPLDGLTQVQHAERCRPNLNAPGCTTTSTLSEDDERPRGGALSVDADAYPWGRHTVCCRAGSCVIGCKSVLTLPNETSELRVDKAVIEDFRGVRQAFMSRLFLPHPMHVLSTTCWCQGRAERPVRIPEREPAMPKLSEGLRDGDLPLKIEATTLINEDGRRPRGGALDGEAEGLKKETKLAPWGRHAESCEAQCCVIGCKSLLTLPHDRSAFVVDITEHSTSLPNGRTSSSSVPLRGQVSATKSQTEVVAPIPTPIPHSLIREEGDGSELSELSEESEGLRGGALDEGGEDDGPWGRRTKLCRTGYCAIRCTSIFNLPHEEDGLEVDKASTEVLVTVTQSGDERPATTLGHLWGVHREGYRPGYCVQGCTAMTNVLRAPGDKSHEDRDTVGQRKYLFGRDVVPSQNSFASIRNEMFDEVESGGASTLASSALPALPTQVPMKVTPSKDSISKRNLKDGGIFAFDRDYARKKSEFVTPSDQLPTWRLGPWIGHDMSCRRVRCALWCQAAITLESMASWSIGKQIAHEKWVVNQVTNVHGDGALAKAFVDAKILIVSEEAVASVESLTDPVLQTLLAAFSAFFQPSDIMLKQPLVMEEVLPTPSSEGRLRGGVLQCTKKKAGWLIDERLRSSFPPSNITQRRELDLPNSPPPTPPLSASQNQINAARKLSAFIPLLPPSPPQSPNNYITKVAALKPFNPYEVWPHNAPFLPPQKGYWSPEYDKSGFWRRPVCPGELHERLSFLPDTGKFRWCDDGTIERVESVYESGEFAQMGLRGGGMNEEDFEWIEDFESSVDTADDESQYEMPNSPPQSPPDEESDSECLHPFMPPLRDLWSGWVTDEEAEETPLLKSPTKRSFDEMMGQMDLHDEKHTAAVTQHHQYGFSLQNDAVDIHYPEIAESSTRVHIADLDNSWGIVRQDDDNDPPSTLSLRLTHQPITPINSPDISASSDSTLSDEDTENTSIYCAAPRRLSQLIVGECKHFSRTLMHHGTGLLMMHRDWCTGTPSSMRYMQDAYSWRQHLKEARTCEERLREKVPRRGIELAQQVEDVKDEKVEWGLRQIVELRTRNEEDRGLMSFKPFERPQPPAEREEIKTGDPRLSKLENVTRLVRQHFKQRCQWRFSWEQWNEVEDIVRRDMEGDGCMPASKEQDGEDGFLIFEREENSIGGGYGLLGEEREKSRGSGKRKA